MSAPRVLVVTDRAQVPQRRTVLDVVADALAAGADGVLVRERDLPHGERARLVDAVGALCADAGAVLLVAAPSPPGLRTPPGTFGVHLRSRDVDRVRELDPDLVAARLVGRSCHGVADLVRAADDGLDLATISPVAPTPSKPGHGPALGLTGLRATLTTARRVRRTLPAVLALGGVDASNARGCLEAGADGVAVMGTVMRAADPASVTRAVVESVCAARPLVR
ncbi:thiamine phosphate synthase [Intrasporangium flavum]|uniref:thiamine phosphate synthase n=1 Tax=Intrasporangium flavum TaxID=1428657 RepID=UPI00096C1AD7|nr:thiamine phosphate synthase [Intrasporangium flavum]